MGPEPRAGLFQKQILETRLMGFYRNVFILFVQKGGLRVLSKFKIQKILELVGSIRKIE